MNVLSCLKLQTNMGTPQTTTTAKKSKWEELFKNRIYFYGVGRRKTSIAQVRIFPQGKGRIYINGNEYRKYFPHFELQKTITKALDLIKEKQNVDLTVKVSGGGIHGQADAISLGASRALIKWNPDFKERLRQTGLLTRDARIKERKKPGLKSARRAPQWSKR